MAGRDRRREESLIERLKTDYGFKTVAAAFGSLLVTVVFALYNGFLGIYHSSLWYGTICAYYILLAVLRGFVIVSEKRAAPLDEKTAVPDKAHMLSSLLLLVLNMSLIVPVSLMVRQQRPVTMTLIPAIAVAAYTTYKITMASVHLKKSRKSVDCLIRLLRTINFIDALVSILVLQNTLIMVNAKEDSAKMLTFTAVTSAVILIAILFLSFSALVSGVVRSKGKECKCLQR